MIIFGGYFGENQGTDSNAVYCFDFTDNSWTCLFELSKEKTAPMLRSGAGCVCVGEELYGRKK